MTFTICFNYGSRQEIIHSIKEIAQAVKNNELNINDIDETVVTNHLYTKDLEPLDLVIRTSGEYRLSNFLLWQISYAELYFTSVLFPDFNKEELYKAILDYQKRDRRFGKIGDK
jgi:undecaprenyl diphosphate synthase